MRRKIIWVITSAFLVIALLLCLVACAQQVPTTPTPATPSAPAQPKTLKVAMNNALTWGLGINMMEGTEVDIDMVNENGGLLIGGERYIIQMIQDDNKMDEALVKTAAQKEIFQDKVKFILGDMWCESLIPLADANKVVLLAYPSSDSMLNTKLKYCFQGTSNLTSFMSITGWAANYLKDKKTVVQVLPDRIDGHFWAPRLKKAWGNNGKTVLDPIFYPPGMTDLSAIGTKIKNLNPDILNPYGGGPDDLLVDKAAYSAGWRGSIVGNGSLDGGIFVQLASAEAVEGSILGYWPTEFEPIENPIARDWKAAYVAKKGQWDYAECIVIIPWWILKSALQQAGNLDTDTVADLLSNGMKYDSLVGPGMMVSRPDLGNSRTVDTITAIGIKQMVGGQGKPMDMLSPEQVYNYCKTIYEW